MNDLSRPRRPHGPGAYLLVIGASLVLGGLAGGASAIIGDQPGPVGTAAMAVGFTACIWWWRGIDEAAREAHKWAWWWGGSGGMAVGSVLLLTLMLRAEEQSLPAKLGSTPADIFVSGMMCILLFQLAGYSLAWAGWWLKHR